jgi:hypothetical protein
MNRFINDVMVMPGGGASMRAAYMLQGAKIDKVSLQNLITRLSTKSMLSNVVISTVDKNSLASGLVLMNAISEVYSRFDDMFTSSNSISLLMENTRMILTSEIKKIESELIDLEKSIDNYGFLLADANSFDSSYIETFSGDNGFENNEVLFTANKKYIEDRAGLVFVEGQIASLVKNEGVITIPPSTNFEYPLSASIWASNCAAFIDSPMANKAISNTTDYKNNNGWRVTANSPIIIDGYLEDFSLLYDQNNNYPGAQFILEYKMPDENPVDLIILEPFSDVPFDLIQVLGFIKEEDNNGVQLLSEPTKVSGTKNIFFPKNTYKKFHIYIRQQLYTREVVNPIMSEANGELINNIKGEIDYTKADGGEAGTKPGYDYPVYNMESHWKMIFSNLRGSLSARDSADLEQGLPSYWSQEFGYLDKNMTTDQDDNINYRSELSRPSNINDSYFQGLIRRFFGTQESGIGAFFTSMKTNMYNTNSPNAGPVNQLGPLSDIRQAPYPRIGEEESINTVAVTEGGGLPDTSMSSTVWRTSSNWDVWLDGIVQSILDKDDMQLVSPNWFWSEKEGRWIDDTELLEAMPRIIDLPTIREDGIIDGIIDTKDYRADHPEKLTPGGGIRYNIPSIQYDDILWKNKSSYKYRYNIGIKYVKAKLSSYGSKSVFVSKPIGVSGDISEVRLKESSTNFVLKGIDLDSEIVTSVEYSVTNSDDISTEASWIPIMPSNDIMVTGERIFPDKDGIAVFRFSAKDQGINLYKNGREIAKGILADIFLRRENNNSVYGLRVPTQLYTSGDLLTVNYIPATDYTTISFDNYSTMANVTAPATDSDGPGEGFYGDGNLEYTLTKIPYIDSTQANASTYSDTFGMTPYQPISIVFSDGTTAINLTNYTNSVQANLDSDSSSYQYIQSGNYIKFNKAVAKNFRVYYNYFPSNFRVRVILRSNTAENVSPKVDFFQVKTKTRKPDAQRD